MTYTEDYYRPMTIYRFESFGAMMILKLKLTFIYYVYKHIFIISLSCRRRHLLRINKYANINNFTNILYFDKPEFLRTIIIVTIYILTTSVAETTR